MRDIFSWLNKHLPTFFEKAGVNWDANAGIISAHGDKAYSYEQEWREHGIPFQHGLAIYLLTYCRPYSKEVRNTEKGWIAPKDWVIDNYFKFRPDLPEIN